MSTALNTLNVLRERSGTANTEGLPDDVIERFAGLDPDLGMVIERAAARREALEAEFGEAIRGSEADLIVALQQGYLNFYAPETVNPFVPLAAQGPWLVTSHGAVLHDSGGYGMLGFGHAPNDVLDAMSAPSVMANIMTPAFSQARLMDRLRAEIGHARTDGCPFHKFVFLNSGSESVTLALRIADVSAMLQTAPGARHEGATVKMLVQQRAFHGRTDRPAQASDSSRGKYLANLASFADRDNLIVVPPNDVAALREAFATAEADGVFIEAMLLEPVQGEGAPGKASSRAFYDAARALTLAHGSMLIIDSIQAGMRAHGTLSVVDYPGFEDADAPDMETYSKALNGGQFPLSVLALSERAAAMYVKGLYGNTMTTNPRALDVACATLDRLTPEVRANIRARGAQLVDALLDLKAQFPHAVLSVTGTGLLCAAELDPEAFPVVGFDGLETWCRRHGLGIIHGGKNALRLTPHFDLTLDEVGLIIDVIRDGLKAFTSRNALATAERVREPTHASP
ncbi:MAG: acetylornithine/succinyldiaminopimelate/putrescine aminotransferase [Myxococcota bacterium]|jgi:acetylornithine/succinyldiaminopimelate/putrescine aminotransferase